MMLCPQTSVEEAVASTAYLELFLRSASAPALLRTFLRFLLLHRHDGSTILDTLIARINSNARVSAEAAPGAAPQTAPRTCHSALSCCPTAGLPHGHPNGLSSHGPALLWGCPMALPHGLPHCVP